MSAILERIISLILSVVMAFSSLGSLGDVDFDINKEDTQTTIEQEIQSEDLTFDTQSKEEEQVVEETTKLESEEIPEMIPPEYETLGEDVLGFDSMSTGSTDVVELDGLGTEDSPYLIYDEEDLIAVAMNSVETTLKSYYRLEADIELTADTWTPIGSTEANAFGGVFDGNGHTISSTVLFQSTGMSGIFGVNTGTIKNLDVTVTIAEVATDTGALVATNKGRVENCHSSGSITSTANKNIGGLVGYNTGVIILSGSSVVVTASNSIVGGLVGYNHNGGVVQYSYATGDVAGRIVGGLIGEQYGYSGTAKTLNSYSMSKVVGSDKAGGLIGYNHFEHRYTGAENGYTYVEYCYARGLVTCSGSYSGGLIGENSGNYGTNYIRFCYYNKANTGNKVGFNESVTNLKKQESFYGWNFDNIWSIDADINLGSPYINIRGEEEIIISGLGTKLDPYIIENEEQLFYLTSQKLNNAFSAYYVLNNDITVTANFWTPIARYGTFSGNFDGNGFTISGINIPNTDIPECGLFGNNSGTVENLTITASTIVGNTNTGAVVANNSGTVSNCYVTESTLSNLSGNNVGGLVGYNIGLVSECGTEIDIESPGAIVGGLVGYNHNGGVVQYSYATGDVTGRIVGGLIGEQYGYSGTAKTLNSYSMSKVVGSDKAGGLIGYNHFEHRYTGAENGYTYVEYCYARGLVTCSGSKSGGLIGENSGNYGANYVKFSYYNSYNTGNKVGFRVPVTAMLDKATFYMWNFDNIWSISSDKNNGSPYINLRGVVKEYELDGYGDEDDPYMICTERDLWALVDGTYNLEAKLYFQLQNDIEITANHWSPIGGNFSIPFNGIFDGNGYTISGLNFSDCYYDDVGLFGVNSGEIKNLNVIATFEGVTRVGAICGNNSGTINNCASTGLISGVTSTQYAGGLVGYNTGKIINSSSTAAVTASSAVVGGLVGYNHNGGVVQYSYATGDVTGRIVGGLIGEQYGYSGTAKTLNSYSMSKVVGSDKAGGLIGYNHFEHRYTGAENGYTYVEYCYARGLVTCSGSKSGGLIGENSGNYGANTVTSSYYDTTVSQLTDIDRGTPLDSNAMKLQSSYVGWDYDTVWAISSAKNNGYPYLRAVEPESVVSVTGITLDAVEKTMQVGSHFYLTATVAPADAANKTVIWSSSNTDVAYVIGGKVIAKAAGTTTITAKTADGSFTETCVVTVNDLVLTGISIKTKPSKIAYFVGDTFDATGLTITATYNDGSTQTITSGFTYSAPSFASAGTKTVTVSYEGFNTTFTVTVATVTVTSITVSTKPNKTTYNVGESLDTTGLKLTVNYSNGTTEVVSTGFNCSPTTFTSAGTKTVTVTYGGKSTTFTVTVNEPVVTITNIAIKTKPNKVVYNVGDSLDTTGLSLTVNYSDGSSKTVTSGFTCNPTALDSVGTKTITVTYGGKTATFTVSVNEVVDVPSDAAQFVVSSTKAKAGKTIDVTVSIKNNPGIVATRIMISYDRNILTLNGVTDGGLLGTGTMIAGNDLTAIPYSVLWEDSLSMVNYSDDGVILTLSFTVNENAEPGTTAISVTYDAGSTFDCDLNDIAFETVDGSVEISDRTPGDANNDDIVNLKDVALIKRWLAGGFDVTIDESNSDINGDGVVNLKDVAVIRRYLAGGFDVELI